MSLPASAEGLATHPSTHQAAPIQQTTTPINVAYLQKLVQNKNRPTVAWAVLGDDLAMLDSNCMTQLQNLHSDSVKTLRVRCETCWRKSPGNKYDAVGRVCKTNQAGDLAGHCAGRDHFAAHLEYNPINVAMMKSRTLNAVGKLRSTVSEYSDWEQGDKKSRAPPKPTYSSNEIDHLEARVNDVDMDNITAAATKEMKSAYCKAFDFGMGSKSSTRGSGVNKIRNLKPNFPMATATVTVIRPPPISVPPDQLPTNAPPPDRVMRQTSFLQCLQNRAKTTDHFFNKSNTSA